MYNTELSRVIQMFNTEYSNFKNKKNPTKEEKKVVFNTICNKIFDLCGEAEGFETINQLKAYISRQKKKKVLNFNTPKKQEEEIGEGSGLIYTLQQIETLNLNYDSYL